MVIMYETLQLAGFALIFLGLVAIFVYIALNSTSTKSQGQTNSSIQGGGVILIGPIPIIFGTNSTMTVIAAVLGLIIFILAAIFFYFLHPH